MDSFNNDVTKWQPFFSTVAAVAATLAGLLFVSLSLNRERITARENHLLLRLAQRSFGDFLFALFIGLMFLIPSYKPYSLALPLFILSAYRGNWLVRSIFRPRRGSGEKLTGLNALREYSFQAISFLGLLFAGIEILRRELAAIYLLVPVVALLLYNATRNAWQLLIIEKNADVQPAGATVQPAELEGK